MDRRYKDYFIVTFKWNSNYNYSPYMGGYITEYFRFARPVKVHWHGEPDVYALVSVPKTSSDWFVRTANQIRGVKKIIPYTEEKESDYAMWQKILRLPENNPEIKRLINRCIKQDLFIDWEEYK